ncbi:Hypothetical protein D9617_1g080410 [Elsinoe fawcettii]|nr:Hypothetical protein D9617_1g080410 [Elsinoe fawcettii]
MEALSDEELNQLAAELVQHVGRVGDPVTKEIFSTVTEARRYLKLCQITTDPELNASPDSTKFTDEFFATRQIEYLHTDWVLYVFRMKKEGEKERIGIGSVTNSNSFQTFPWAKPNENRSAQYVLSNDLCPSKVRKSLEEGFVLTDFFPVLRAKRPRRDTRRAAQVQITMLVLETVYSFRYGTFWRKDDETFPSWGRMDDTCKGLNTHPALWEVRNETVDRLGMSEEQLANIRREYRAKRNKLRVDQYWKDPDHSRALARAWAKRNPEKVKLKRESWKRRNPGLVKDQMDRMHAKQEHRRKTDPVFRASEQERQRKLAARKRANPVSNDHVRKVRARSANKTHAERRKAGVRFYCPYFNVCGFSRTQKGVLWKHIKEKHRVWYDANIQPRNTVKPGEGEKFEKPAAGIVPQ